MPALLPNLRLTRDGVPYLPLHGIPIRRLPLPEDMVGMVRHLQTCHRSPISPGWSLYGRPSQRH
jgi:hypothetical protein